jgi:hypothetical protein
VSHSHICRVCGQQFRSPRVDAFTCSDTCRKRRQRGGDLAYLARDEFLRPSAETYQAAHLEAVRARQGFNRAVRKSRALRRESRRMKLEIRQQNLRREIRAELYPEVLKEIAGWQARIASKPSPKLLGPVAGALKLFHEQRRNDTSARAIAQFLSWPEEEVQQALTELAATS